jgi:hypothetical protein
MNIKKNIGNNVWLYIEWDMNNIIITNAAKASISYVDSHWNEPFGFFGGILYNKVREYKL